MSRTTARLHRCSLLVCGSQRCRGEGVKTKLIPIRVKNIPPASQSQLTLSSSITQQVLSTFLNAPLQPWSNRFNFDLRVLLWRRVWHTSLTVMTHSLQPWQQSHGRIWQMIPQVRTTGWQIHADRADQRSLTANWSRFCIWSQLGENREISAGSLNTSVWLSRAF